MSSSKSRVEISRMSFWDMIYTYFGGLGRRLLRVYYNLPYEIRRNALHIYPEVYASLTVFILIISIIITVFLSILFYIIGYLIIIPFITLIPFITFLLMIHLPALIGSSRASGLEGEIPYTASYLNIMVMSGLSPYKAFERIVDASRIFTKSTYIAQRFILLVRVLGKDPLTAFSLLSERNPSPTLRDLLTGYISTVRAGGDVVDYLSKKARLLFSELLVKMKISADRLASLLESYLALTLLTLIVLTVMYFVTLTYGGVLAFGISPGVMFIILYVLIPMISGMIIYLADIIQYKEPWIDWRPYYLFFGLTIPLIAYLSIFGLILYSALPSGHPLRESFLVSGFNMLLTFPARVLNLPGYIHPAVGFSMVLIISTLPTVVYAEMKLSEQKIVDGITKFLRDFVEIRKTGMSPERAIIELSNRSYGKFTPILKKIALQLSIGIPLKRIIDEILKKNIVWRAKVLLFVMTDTIEVGGGSIETLETLAWFAESVDAIDVERRKTLRTLLIVPYMGALLSTSTIILLTVFFGSIQYGIGGYIQAALTTLPAIVLNSYIMGLVAGKVSSGSVAAGFKHALILTLFTLIFLLISPLMGSVVGLITRPVT